MKKLSLCKFPCLFHLVQYPSEFGVICAHLQSRVLDKVPNYKTVHTTTGRFMCTLSFAVSNLSRKLDQYFIVFSDRYIFSCSETNLICMLPASMKSVLRMVFSITANNISENKRCDILEHLVFSIVQSSRIGMAIFFQLGSQRCSMLPWAQMLGADRPKGYSDQQTTYIQSRLWDTVFNLLYWSLSSRQQV